MLKSNQTTSPTEMDCQFVPGHFKNTFIFAFQNSSYAFPLSIIPRVAAAGRMLRPREANTRALERGGVGTYSRSRLIAKATCQHIFCDYPALPIKTVFTTYCHVDRDASLSVGKLLLHHYKSDLAHISDLYSLVIGVYKSGI